MSEDLSPNPYQSFGHPDLVSQVEGLPDGKRSWTPRAIGVLNILFGTALGLCAICQGFSVFGQVAAAPQMQQIFQQRQAQLQQQVDKLRALRDQEPNDRRAEEIDLQIDAITEEIDILEIIPNPMVMWGFDRPNVLGFFAIECVLTLLLNLAMFISGIGLLGFNQWARKMAIWVAAVKLVNIVVVAIVMLTIVVPIALESMQEFMLPVVQDQAVVEPVPIAQMQRQMLEPIWTTIFLFAAAAAIYPVICLWQLNRSFVKRSCQTKVVAAS